MRGETTTIYAVYWQQHGVLKVGIEKNDKRHKMWERRGPELAALFTDVPAAWERKALAALTQRFLRAFDSERDAMWLLSHGYGHTECFIVSPELRTEALRIVASAIGSAE